MITNVHVLPDKDLLRNLCAAVAAFWGFCIGRRLQSLYSDSNPNLAVPSDGNPRRVMKTTISADDDILTQTQMVAVVASKGRSNMTGLSHMSFDSSPFLASLTRVQDLFEKVVDRVTR